MRPQKVQKRASANQMKKQGRGFHDIHFSHDLLFKIFLLLPAESLHRASFVCKAWFNLINSSNFVEAHILQAEPIVMFLKSVSPPRPKTFSIESKLSLSKFSRRETDNSPVDYLSYVEVQNGEGKEIESNISGFHKILATCNGLVLASRQETRSLLVINPVTRKVLALPRGAIILPHAASYGFVFSHLSREYKVVHLFRDDSKPIACEIISLTTRLWRAVDDPPSEHFGRFFLRKPVPANGSLHWLPSSGGCSCIVSMGIDDEKFHTRILPNRSRTNDRLVEIGGFLSFVTHAAADTLQIWILKESEGEGWVKRHTITSTGIRNLVPTCTMKRGRELFFFKTGDHHFCAYDMETLEMRKVEFDGVAIWRHDCYFSYLPHANTLASWESRLVARW
ncbi:F-box protein CPR1-like [Actinidia eriantha]|uniref:F-box protein CPR1-like n=1 Tax=Actinidia eriantha TaxID=165200 RepID=UPI00258D42F3|nr:F-box protein CPR1-like [Actinidia eriantha]XP_057468521.1 F-box protein CPR1-like [Actinidia eriantha]XP_057468522.1 F-box protein CPR1-like [Actinidia eriantha]XP_057468523.1 F-box protein CPR1-like [Actinidia eriantha]XP_057468524.1 F-box protein CPR1-like [Actinidia eriantha]XP_057468525.1 F-box protein CPR1-like [Actinidia eriantha]XP_057468526.1 F-box protein CPR1-like [Actinidia eriantha]XP_057468527.1 F-box protein CPR1-like [Actinidia eriantha]XP_057468528.1 F-box protein CPR1-l